MGVTLTGSISLQRSAGLFAHSPGVAVLSWHPKGPFGIAIEIAHEAADAERDDELPLHGLENLLPVVGDHEQLFAVRQILQRCRRPRCFGGAFLERAEAATDHLQTESMPRQILHNFQANEIMERI